MVILTSVRYNKSLTYNYIRITTNPFIYEKPNRFLIILIFLFQCSALTFYNYT